MIKKKDIYLIASLIAISLISYFFIYFIKGQGEMIIITVHKTEYAVHLLGQDDEITIESENDKNVLIIKDGQAYMKEATCRDKLCVNHAPISKDGDMIVCLPNEVVVQVKKGTPSEVDAITRSRSWDEK